MDVKVKKIEIKRKLSELFDELFEHEGYGDLCMRIRILSRGQKEVVIDCGKQYRYIVDYNPKQLFGKK